MLRTYPFDDPLSSVDTMLDVLNKSFPKVEDHTPDELRALIQSRMAPVTNMDDFASAKDVTVGAGLRLRLYRPHDMQANAPVILFFHGGGFVFCTIENHDGFCRRMARETGALVVSVDYRLAPEHPYPAAVEDAQVALRSVVGSAGELGCDPKRIFAAGDSAGGNLATVLCLAARDKAIAPMAGQVLLYPVIAPEFDTAGYRRFGDGHYNTRAGMEWYWRQYLGPNGLPQPPDYAAPIKAASLAGLPPALVVIPGRDPTCSEGRDYAAALRAAGVPVRLRDYPDMFHGFMTMMSFGPAHAARAVLWADMSRLMTRKGDGE